LSKTHSTKTTGYSFVIVGANILALKTLILVNKKNYLN